MIVGKFSSILTTGFFLRSWTTGDGNYRLTFNNEVNTWVIFDISGNTADSLKLKRGVNSQIPPNGLTWEYTFERGTIQIDIREVKIICVGNKQNKFNNTLFEA